MIGFFNGTITHTMDLKTVEQAFECTRPIPMSWAGVGTAGAEVVKAANPQKIFLMGGTGRTGLNFARLALDAGHSVTAVVRREPKVPGTLATSGNVVGTGSSKELDGTEA
jgi:hypothetical protein